MDKIISNNGQQIEKLLQNLRDSQRLITHVGNLCLANHVHSKDIVKCWLKIYKKTKDDKKKLLLLYIANHIIQYSRKKKFDYSKIWKIYLPSVLNLVTNEHINIQVLRMIHIWLIRNIYNKQFLYMLTKIVKKSILKVNTLSDLGKNSLKIRIDYCKYWEAETKTVFETLPKQLCYNINYNKMCVDRNVLKLLIEEINRSKRAIENYKNYLYAEIVSRSILISEVKNLIDFFDSEKEDAKKVQKAYILYTCNMIKCQNFLNSKIQDLDNSFIWNVVNAVSPEPSYTITLPDDQIKF